MSGSRAYCCYFYCCYDATRPDCCLSCGQQQQHAWASDVGVSSKCSGDVDESDGVLLLLLRGTCADDCYHLAASSSVWALACLEFPSGSDRMSAPDTRTASTWGDGSEPMPLQSVRQFQASVGSYATAWCYPRQHCSSKPCSKLTVQCG